jgi:hypothetical protein
MVVYDILVTSCLSGVFASSVTFAWLEKLDALSSLTGHDIDVAGFT